MKFTYPSVRSLGRQARHGLLKRFGGMQWFGQRTQWDGRHTCGGTYVPRWTFHQSLDPKGTFTIKIRTVGIDLAKNVLQVHGIDERGKAALKKQPQRVHMATVSAGISTIALPRVRTVVDYEALLPWRLAAIKT